MIESPGTSGLSVGFEDIGIERADFLTRILGRDFHHSSSDHNHAVYGKTRLGCARIVHVRYMQEYLVAGPARRNIEIRRR